MINNNHEIIIFSFDVDVFLMGKKTSLNFELLVTLTFGIKKIQLY